MNDFDDELRQAGTAWQQNLGQPPALGPMLAAVPKRDFRPVVAALAGLSVITLAAGAVLLYRPGQVSPAGGTASIMAPSTSESTIPQPSASNAPDLNEPEAVLTWGDNASPKLTVKIYYDYGCPYCVTKIKPTADKIKELAKAGYDFEFIPISILDGTTSGYSTKATNAVKTAAASGKATAEALWDLNFTLLNADSEEGKNVSDAAIAKAALKVGVPQEVVDTFADGLYDDWADVQTKRAEEQGIAGVPTLLVEVTYADGGSYEFKADVLDDLVASDGSIDWDKYIAAAEAGLRPGSSSTAYEGTIQATEAPEAAAATNATDVSVVMGNIEGMTDANGTLRLEYSDKASKAWKITSVTTTGAKWNQLEHELYNNATGGIEFSSDGEAVKANAKIKVRQLDLGAKAALTEFDNPTDDESAEPIANVGIDLATLAGNTVFVAYDADTLKIKRLWLGNGPVSKDTLAKLGKTTTETMDWTDDAAPASGSVSYWYVDQPGGYLTVSEGKLADGTVVSQAAAGSYPDGDGPTADPTAVPTESIVSVGDNGPVTSNPAALRIQVK
ncbi:MAG: thioredoxin domain-containing protein [Propionibacteriaceae bacterium]|jgi:protein-disulfide isomerase|nr:thioredoxin domain-containing protein [Propionibacteriaceae bacterium]